MEWCFLADEFVLLFSTFLSIGILFEGIVRGCISVFKNCYKCKMMFIDVFDFRGIMIARLE